MKRFLRGNKFILILTMILLFFTVSCSPNEEKDNSTPPNENSSVISTTAAEISFDYTKPVPQELLDSISGSYTLLDFVPQTEGYSEDSARQFNGRFIWEHTVFTTELTAFGNKRETTFYSFDPNKPDAIRKLALSSTEQENYAGIRILKDKIMVKTRESYSYLNNLLDPIGKPVIFPEDLIKDLKKIEKPDASYFNHFDISADGRYVYYTDENKQSIFRYDVMTKEKTTLINDLAIQPEENSDRIPYQLYDILLTPNDQFLIAKISGYMEAYHILNLQQPSQSFTVKALPVNIKWSNIDNIIPMYADENVIHESNLTQLDLILFDLEKDSRKDIFTITLDDNNFDKMQLLSATFNQNYWTYTSYDTKKAVSEPLEDISKIWLFNYNDRQINVPIKSKFQLNVAGVTDDGHAIVRFTSMYGDFSGYLLTSISK